MIWYDIIWSQL